MAVSFTPTYFNQRQYLYDTALSSDKFDSNKFNQLDAIDSQQADMFAEMSIGAKNKISTTFNTIDYERLNAEDSLLYLYNEFYQDKTEITTDEETGETYNVYERNNEYLQYKIQEAIDQEIYDSLSGWDKFWATVGTTLASAATEIYGVLEGLIDGVTWLLGASADLITFGQFHEEISEGTKWALSQDVTGVGYLRGEINDITRKYTYIDKSTGWKIFNDVVVGIAQMAPLALNFVAPGVGTVVYYGSMAGRTAEETVISNPDIDLGALTAYTAASVGAEALIENLSGKVFGAPSGIDNLISGGSSVVRKGGFLRRIFTDMATEGLEESVSEFANSVLNIAFVDHNAPLASFQDILYAGLIGGLIGGIATGGSIATTRRAFVTKEGEITTYKNVKEAQKAGINTEGVRLTRMQTIDLKSALAEATQTMRQSAVSDLQAKYSNLTLNEIQTQHAEEYQKAIDTDTEKQKSILDTTMALSKILETAGAEGFAKATELAQYTIDQQSKFIRRFTEYSPSENAKLAIVESKINKANPNSKATITEDLNATQLKIRDAFKKMGIDLYFAEYGEIDGQMRQHETVLDEKTVVMDADLFKTASYDYILDKVAKRSLVKTLQTQSGVLNKNALSRLKMLLFSNKSYDFAKFDDVAYLNDAQIEQLSDKELKQYADKQAEVLAQTLLFDELTVRKVFLGDNTTFKGVYKWLDKTKAFLENFARKDDLNKVKYNSILKSMRLYENVIADTSLNEQYAQDAAKDISADPAVMKRIGDRFDSKKHSKTFEHYAYVPLNTTKNNVDYISCIEGLHNITNGKFTYEKAFNPDIYTQEFRASLEQSMKRGETFQHALQNYLISTYGKVIDTSHSRIVDVMIFRNHISKKFDTALQQLLTNKIDFDTFTSQFKTVSDIFDDEFNSRVFDEFNNENLSDITLRFEQIDRTKKKDEWGTFNVDTNELTVFVDPTIEEQTKKTSELSEMEHTIYHETQHIIANWFNMYRGGNPDSLAIALSTKQYRQTAKNIWNRFNNITFDELVRQNGESEAFKKVGEFVYSNMAGELLAESTGETTDITAVYGTNDYFDAIDTDYGYMIKGHGKFSTFFFNVDYSVWMNAFQRKIIQTETEVAEQNAETKQWMTENNITLDGFSQEFIDAFNSDELSSDVLWDMVNTDTVGDDKATNTIIKYLAPNNTNITNIRDVEIALSKGLPMAKTYFMIRKQHDSQFSKTKNFSLSKIETFITEHPTAEIEYTTKSGTHKITLTNYLVKQYDKLTEALSVKNAKQIIIESDFAYNSESVDAVLKKLRNARVTTSFKEVQTTLGNEKSAEREIIDVRQAEEYTTEESSFKEEGEETVEKRLNRIYDTTLKQLKDWLTTSGKSGETYVIKDILQKIKSESSQLTQEQKKQYKVYDLTNVDTLIEIIDDVLTDENGFSIYDKLKNNKDVINEIYGDAAYDTVKEHLSEKGIEDKSTFTKRANRLKDKLKKLDSLTQEQQELLDVSTKNFTPTQYEEYIEKLKNTTTVSRETPVSTEKIILNKTIVEEQKEPVTKTIQQREPTINEKTKKQQTIENAETILGIETITQEEQQRAKEQTIPITELVITDDVRKKNALIKNIMVDEDLSQYNGDTTNKDYLKAETKTIEKNITFFENIKSNELQVLMESLAIELDNPEAYAALVLLTRYAYNNRFTQFKDIADFVKERNRLATTYAASQLGGMSQIYGKHQVKEALNELALTTGTEIQIPEQIVLTAVDNQYDSVESYSGYILSEIEKLTEQIKKTKDPYKKYVLKEQLKTFERIMNAIESEDNAAIIDAIMEQLDESEENVIQNQQKKADIARTVVEFMLEHSEIKNNTVTLNKKRTILSPANKEKIMNFWSGLTTFRYLAMLSSPKTAAKNAVSNTLVACKAILDDAITGRFEKTQVLQQESQVSFNGEFDAEFGEYVENKYLARVKKQTEGDRYYEKQLNEIKADLAKEKNPLLRKKLFAKIDTWEKKMLQDKPWTQRRAMRNLKNTLAGAMTPILNESKAWLIAKYKGKFSKTDITQEQLLQNIRKTNSELAELSEKAFNGDMISVLKLGEQLGVSLLNLDNPNNIIDVSIYRANELFFKTDNWYTTTRANLKKKHPNVVVVLDLIFPFMRTTINTSAYMINHSPVGIVKGIMGLLQTKNVYAADMASNIDQYYRQVFTHMKQAEFKEKRKATGEKEYYSFKKADYVAWFEKNVPIEVQTALNTGKYNLLKTVHDKLVADGKIPQGLVGISNPYSRALAFEKLSQGLTGTAFMALGAILAAATKAFDYEDDDDYLGPIIRIGDLKIPLDDLAPFTTMFTVGAMLKSSDNWSTNLARAFKVFADQSLFSVMDSAIAYSSDVWDFAANQALNVTQQFIPSILKNIAKVVDNSKKDKSGSWGVKFLKTTASNIPGLSYFVPNKINPYTGETEMYYEGGFFESLLNQVLPFSFRIEAQTAFEKDAVSLGAKTTGLNGRFIINGKDYSVSDTKKTQLSSYRANYLQTEYQKIVDGKQLVTVEDKNGKRITTTYNKLTDEQKANVLKNLYSKATDITKIKYWIDSGNVYYTSNKDEYNRLRKTIPSGIYYNASWNKSKFVER